MLDSSLKKTAQIPDAHPHKDLLHKYKHTQSVFTSTTMREEEYTSLYTQQLFPLEKDYSCVVVFLHGMAAYSSREFPFMAYLVDTLDACVCSIDHIGHGFSDGLPGYVDDVKLCAQDVVDYSLDCQKKYLKEGMKMFLVGYSMGGLIALHSVRKSKDLFDGCIFVAPLILPKEMPNSFVVTVAHVFNYFAPTYPLLPLINNASQLQENLENFQKDELNYRGKMRIGTGLAMQEGFLDIQQNLHEIYVPFFVGFGDTDFVCDMEGGKLLLEKSPQKDKELKIYKGQYHDIFWEPSKDEIFADIKSWIEKRLK